MKRKLRAVFAAAECVPGCEDQECPYIHGDYWHVSQGEKYVEGPFDTKAEAETFIANVTSK